MSRILVTGASGFLGGALARNLEDEGHTVVVLVRDHSKEYYPTSSFVVHGDLSNYDILRRAISDYEVEHVYHLGAQSIVRACANDPVSAYQSNVMGTVNLLEAIRTTGMNNIKSIIVSTSDKAYGHAPVPYTEDTPLMPKFTYECTKACQDIVAQNYFHNYGLPVKIARCSNIYGPGDPNWSRLIPNTITKLKAGVAPVIYADVANYIREFLYIDDVINAFKLISDKGISGEAYCVGGFSKVSVTDLVEIITILCTQAGINCQSPVFPERPIVFKEIQEQYIDGTKIKALGWNPVFSLEQGLRHTVNYYLDEENNVPNFRR